MTFLTKIIGAFSLLVCTFLPQLYVYTQETPSQVSSQLLLEQISISELAKSCGFSISYDSLAGKVKLRSSEKENFTEVIIVPGMNVVTIDGEICSLPEKVFYRSGDLMLPVSLLRAVQDKMALKKKPEKPPSPEEQETLKKKQFNKVVIDPGHGGKFPGATGWGQVEADINLKIALKLKRLLEGAGIKVVMTRQADTHLSEDWSEDLDARVNLANRENPDAFISIHTNSSQDKSATGFEIFVAPIGEDLERRVAKAVRETPIEEKNFGMAGALPHSLSFDFHRLLLEEYYRESRKLANDIMVSMSDILSEPNRGVKEESFRVIKWTRCPAVLVEVGFVSNRETARRLSRSEYQTSIAEGIAQGILNFKKEFDKTEGYTKSYQKNEAKEDVSDSDKK